MVYRPQTVRMSVQMDPEVLKEVNAAIENFNQKTTEMRQATDRLQDAFSKVPGALVANPLGVQED